MIKFKLTKFEKHLVFQITDMHPAQINKDESSDLFRLINNVNVCSSTYPEINVDNNGKVLDIFLWGRDHSKNLNIVIISCEDNISRDKIYDVIVDTIKQWAKTGGFKTNNISCSEFNFV